MLREAVRKQNFSFSLKFLSELGREGILNALPPTIFYCVICSRVFAAQRERFPLDIQLKFLMSLGVPFHTQSEFQKGICR